jgi:CD109 antigen
MAMPMMAFAAVSRSAEVSDDVSIASESKRDTRTKRREQRTLRQAFPETWLWATADVDSDGNAVMFSSVPDTITTWDISGFALGSQTGLGLPLGHASVRVFKPLFVQLKLPYKVVRGEVLEVVMTVFNYINEAQEITLVLEGRGGADVPINAANQQLSIAPNSAASRSAMLTFDTVGTATLRLSGVGRSASTQDAVERTLKVVPEGVQHSTTVSVMLQPSEEADGVQQLTLPAHNRSGTGAVVPGSLYTRLALSGDLMGPSLEGLDSLVRLPSGCGEQNMILMAPNVYIINYLTAKRDMRSDLRDRALRFIQVRFLACPPPFSLFFH